MYNLIPTNEIPLSREGNVFRIFFRKMLLALLRWELAENHADLKSIRIPGESLSSVSL